MPKTLIAIMTCHKRLYTWAKAIRETWLPLVPHSVDVRFFVGNGEGSYPAADIVPLDCSDLYDDIPEKVRAIMAWSFEHGYDHTLKCDDDTVVRPIALLSSGYQDYDFVGKENRPLSPFPVPMGFNYWLSRRCAEIISKSPLPIDYDDERWVAEMLSKHGILLHNDDRYWLYSRKECGVVRKGVRLPFRLGNHNDKEIFSRCIYLFEDEDKNIAEFYRVFHMFGGV
jgi:Galactosyltransferase